MRGRNAKRGWRALAWGLVLLTLGCGETSEPRRSATDGASNATTSAGATAGSVAGLSSTGGSSGDGVFAGASATGGSNAVDDGGTAGASSSGAGVGGSAACPDVAVDDRAGIVATVDGETIEFRRDLLWYDGRPPTLDLSALTDAAGWLSFRIFIDPDTDAVVPGVYQSGPGNVTYVIARRETGDYDTIDNNASTICVTEAGRGAGARVAGSFSATLDSHDGSSSLAVTGTFSGTLAH